WCQQARCTSRFSAARVRAPVRGQVPVQRAAASPAGAAVSGEESAGERASAQLLAALPAPPRSPTGYRSTLPAGSYLAEEPAPVRARATHAPGRLGPDCPNLRRMRPLEWTSQAPGSRRPYGSSYALDLSKRAFWLEL